jgi:type VI protein secretion system component VasK
MLWLSVISTICWPICFWWMWRISTRQNALIHELHRQTREIEKVARDEHAMLKDAEPKIGEIKDTVRRLEKNDRG